MTFFKKRKTLKPALLGLVLMCLALEPAMASYYAKNSAKIRFQPKKTKAGGSLDSAIKRVQPNFNFADTFNSTVFKADKTSPSSVIWLHDPTRQEKRSRIHTESIPFEFWWKNKSEAFLTLDKANKTGVLRNKAGAKILSRLFNNFYGHAEFELRTSSGSIQKIYQEAGESNNMISQKEFSLLWQANEKFTLKGGAVNQSFLNAPLLMSDIAFPSLVASFTAHKNKTNSLSFHAQPALLNTFSESNLISTQDDAGLPLFFTLSASASRVHPKYTINIHFTGFLFYGLTNDILRESLPYGNTPAKDYYTFHYKYRGFHAGIEPSFQLFTNLGLKLKLHYLNNMNSTTKNTPVNQGILGGITIPIDITANMRAAFSLEGFINQPDSSVGYYSSERYGRNDRKGWAVEGIMNLYNRNMDLGFRYLRTHPIREMSLRGTQDYYLFFVRANYAKI